MKNGKQATVRDIMMSFPVTLSPDDNLELASNVISLGRIRHIPVVEQGKLVGLISARDLISAATDRVLGLKEKNKSALLKTQLVKKVMKRKVVTVAPDTPIKDAARLMADRKIGCVPVISEGALVGLVTTTNVLRYIGSIE